MSDEPMLSTEELAAYLGLKPYTITEWRRSGKGPSWTKFGDGKKAPVRYLRSDVDTWISSQTLTP